MAPMRPFAALLVLGLATTACGPVAREASNTSLYSVNQPVVQRTDYVLDLATSPDGVAGPELERLNGWFQSLDVGYGDRVAIDEPGGYGDGTVREDVAEVAASYGLLVGEGAPVTAGSVQPGTVRVVVSRTTASVPNCPNWEGRGGRTNTSPNYGCSVNSNVAAMVADPNDLVLGQAGSGTSDPATASRAIRTHRNAQPTGAGGLPQVRTGGQ